MIATGGFGCGKCFQIGIVPNGALSDFPAAIDGANQMVLFIKI